tara:strand:- start:608 stop:754 length:147 start_codon:yes stop_codon:yes gene_type:complete
MYHTLSNVVSAKVTGEPYIRISHETDKELLVLIGEDPKALVLTKKTVK